MKTTSTEQLAIRRRRGVMSCVKIRLIHRWAMFVGRGAIQIMALVTLFSCHHSTEPQNHDTGPDTTSHNLAVEITTLGDNSCVGRDVAIVGPGDAWLGGFMYVRTGASSDTATNAAHWDGQNWTIAGVPLPICAGNTGVAYSDLFAIATSGSDLWFTPGWGFVHKSPLGTEHICYPESIQAGPILRLMARSVDDIWAVGYSGSVIHYDGLSWHGRNIPTDIMVIDVAESPDRKRVWACGYKPDQSQSGLFMLDSAGWHTIAHNPPYGGSEELFTSVWTCDNDSVWVLGNVGVFKFSQKPPFNFVRQPVQLSSFAWMIRGLSNHDVFVCGWHGSLLHFNGNSWKAYSLPVDMSDNLLSIAVSPTDVFAVGSRNADGVLSKVVVYHGRR